MSASGEAFERLLQSWSTWYRLRRAAQAGMLGLITGLAAWCALGASVLAWRWLTQGEYLRMGAGGTLGLLLLSALAGLLLPAPRMQTMRFFERTFHLQERASTALELRTLPLEPATPEAQALRLSQLEDTLAHAGQVRPRAGFFIPWRRRHAGLLGVLLALNLGLFFLGQAPFQQAAQQRQVQQAIEQAVEQIESLRAQVALDPALSEAQREQILQELIEASQALQAATSGEQAAASLAEAVADLQALDNAQARQQVEALHQAGSQLQQSLPPGGTSPLSDFAAQLAAGDLLAAAEALQTLDPANLSAAEAAELADQLESAAEALAATNPELASQLSQAAQALEQGDAQAAQQALQQAASQVAQTQQAAADAQAAAQAAAQVAQGQQQLLQSAGLGTQAGAGSAASGSQPGQGAGSGSGAGESAGSETQGGEVGSSPIQPGQPSDGGEKPYTELFAPQRLGLSEGETVALPPSNQTGEQVIGSGDTTPGQPGVFTVPYASVYADYARAYWQAYDTSTVPLSLREVARKYFSSLGFTNP